MSDAAVTSRASPRARRVLARKAHADRQKALRAKQKARFEEALAMLEKIGDDDPILIIGKDAECP